VVDPEPHLALCVGGVGVEVDGSVPVQKDPVLVRIHSQCLTGDIFNSLLCDCGSQLHQAMHQVRAAGKGVVLYMRQEGRGIGLLAKLQAYKLQQQEGLDTVEANQRLGFGPDLRHYGIGAQILVDLGIRQIRLLTNNPKKVVGLDGYDLRIVERVPIQVPPNQKNRRYLKTKKDKLGHLLDDMD
jgi:3,4-dihydroxy 2-butanone 4-phosphate synthase/GTP cyclohydrolase II